jgi:hypothetical protein
VDQGRYLDNDGNAVVAEMLTVDRATPISMWANAMAVEEIDPTDSTLRFPGLNVQTKDGVKRASLGDYVVKHSDGSFDVVKPMRFRQCFMSMEL